MEYRPSCEVTRSVGQKISPPPLLLNRNFYYRVYKNASLDFILSTTSNHISLIFILILSFYVRYAYVSQISSMYVLRVKYFMHLLFSSVCYMPCPSQKKVLNIRNKYSVPSIFYNIFLTASG
jgi:hypothetical protein